MLRGKSRVLFESSLKRDIEDHQIPMNTNYLKDMMSVLVQYQDNEAKIQHYLDNYTNSRTYIPISEMLSKLVEAKENQMKMLSKYSDFEEAASATEMEKKMHQVANDQAEFVCESYEDLEYIKAKTAKLL